MKIKIDLFSCLVDIMALAIMGIVIVGVIGGAMYLMAYIGGK